MLVNKDKEEPAPTCPVRLTMASGPLEMHFALVTPIQIQFSIKQHPAVSQANIHGVGMGCKLRDQRQHWWRVFSQFHGRHNNEVTFLRRF